jgi:hypothetical protein
VQVIMQAIPLCIHFLSTTTSTSTSQLLPLLLL